MKTTLVFLFLVSVVIKVQAQQAVYVTVTPSAPVSTDTIIIYITTNFANSPCGGSAVSTSSGYSITVHSTHCIGQSTTICSDLDTIILNPPHLPGVHKLKVILQTGVLPLCTSGSGPTSQDSIQFYIGSSATSVEKLPGTFFRAEFYPNPADEFIFVSSNCDNVEIELYDLTGKTLFLEPLDKGKFSTTSCPKGMYFLKLKQGRFVEYKKIQVIH